MSTATARLLRDVTDPHETVNPLFRVPAGTTVRILEDNHGSMMLVETDDRIPTNRTKFFVKASDVEPLTGESK